MRTKVQVYAKNSRKTETLLQLRCRVSFDYKSSQFLTLNLYNILENKDINKNINKYFSV